MLTHYNNYNMIVGYSPPGEYLNNLIVTTTRYDKMKDYKIFVETKNNHIS